MVEKGLNKAFIWYIDHLFRWNGSIVTGDQRRWRIPHPEMQNVCTLLIFHTICTWCLSTRIYTTAGGIKEWITSYEGEFQGLSFAMLNVHLCIKSLLVDRDNVRYPTRLQNQCSVWDRHNVPYCVVDWERTVPWILDCNIWLKRAWIKLSFDI